MMNDNTVFTRDIEDSIRKLQQGEQELDGEEKTDLVDLLAFREDGVAITGECSWTYGVVLVRADYFETYAKEYAQDIGHIDRLDSWPARHINWEQATDELRGDFSTVEFRGVRYYVPR